MSVISWLHEAKNNNPLLAGFIAKLEPFISETGFNAIDFERKINNGVKNIDTEVDKALIQQTDVKD